MVSAPPLVHDTVVEPLKVQLYVMEFVVSVMLAAYFRHVFAAVVEGELVADVESPVFAQPNTATIQTKVRIDLDN